MTGLGHNENIVELSILWRLMVFVSPLYKEARILDNAGKRHHATRTYGFVLLCRPPGLKRNVRQDAKWMSCYFLHVDSLRVYMLGEVDTECFVGLEISKVNLVILWIFMIVQS